MAKTYAIGNAGIVRIWCEGTLEDFTVINGAWGGSWADGQLTVKAPGGDKVYPADLLWQGHVPRGQGIGWIQAQVDAGITESPALTAPAMEEVDGIPF